MRRSTPVGILFPLALLAALCSSGLAQDAAAPAQARKVTSRVLPAYPELAKQIRLRGTVRLVAVVAPNGTVKETEPLGGSPLLLKSAADAVRQWKYVTAPAESREVIEIQFEPK